jgi:2'-5' RNA ligase
MDGDQILTYWLLPAEPTRTFFSELIAKIAARFDAPVFESHLTLHVTKAEDENPGTVLETVAKGRQPYRLAVRGLDYSDEFTKTLFVQFAPDAEVSRLSDEIRRASASQNDYELNPHVSLIYKTMDDETKRQLASSLTLPFSEVVFDSVKAVLSPAEIKSREDVEAWRVIAEARLSE